MAEVQSLKSKVQSLTWQWSENLGHRTLDIGHRATAHSELRIDVGDQVRNIKLTLEYVGTNYYGFQRQPNRPTVQGELERVLTTLLGEEIKVTGAGRTDVGVHALHQVANFKTNSTMAPSRLQWSANSLLPSDIVITRVEEVPLSFHARRQAVAREYKYYILNRGHPSAFQRDRVYFLARPLDVVRMQEAARVLVGTHDFSAFCGGSHTKPSRVRTINELKCEKEGDLIIITVSANAFLPQMVRTLVGTLIRVGEGNLSADEVKEILGSKDRKKAGPTAPACGLVLTNIVYPE